jgi:hypothetical protein
VPDVCRSGIAAAFLWIASTAFGAVEGPGRTQLIRAVRVSTSPSIDGKLSEPQWLTAPVFDKFVQQFPEEGSRPSERTEVRVLYDDDNLYVGIICYDSHPERILRQLGRRDRIPASDTVGFAIDSGHGHREAFAFTVNAAGVLQDSLWFQDNQNSDDWDAVWDAAVSARPDGWSAEFAIPLNLLRFSDAPVQTWGFFVRREIARTHEVIDSVLIPRNANGFVSRFGHLSGLRGLKQKTDIEVTPYLAARGTLRPQFSDPSIPKPRLLDPSIDVGFDLKAAVTRGLTLDATVNPDFGQVEADQVILNLTNFEQFFPEKRPFFTHGLDLFQPVGGDVGHTPQTLFYSRRIGLITPILGAAKLTGTAAKGLDIGVLDAFVAGASVPNSDEAHPDRGLGYFFSRPLHLGLKDSFPPLNPVPENYFAAVVKKQVAGNSTLGAVFAAATPIAPRCTEDQANLPDETRPPYCDERGGNAAAIDWNLRTADSQWVVLGQVDGSQSIAGSPSRALKDGTIIRPGDLGSGGYLSAGKFGGEPFRFDLRYEFASPKLDLNATGFQPNQNVHTLRTALNFVRPSGFGPLRSFNSYLLLEKNWSSDGRFVDRGFAVSAGGSAVLRSFHSFGWNTSFDVPQFDIREVGFTGIPYQRPNVAYFSVFGQSDGNRAISAGGSLGLAWRPNPQLPVSSVGYNGNFRIVVHPHPSLETQLETAIDYTPHGARYVDTIGSDQFIFGTLDSRLLSLTLRQQLVLTPRLTLQAYAQLFSAFGRYGAFYSAMSRGQPIRISDLVPTEYPFDPSFHTAALNINLVLRWEYRLGSTLFLVYSRSQSALPTPPGTPVPATLLPVGLGPGPTTETFLVKWSYWWNL